MKHLNKQHFSHEHTLIPLQPEEGEELICEACQELIDELFYGCLDCSFWLHDICSEAPRSMEHPSHPSHPLTLHQNPTYPNRTYGCNACGVNGKGFSFSCAHCEFDLHLLCCGLPQTFLFEKEHPHEFKLVCEPEKIAKLTCYICRARNQGYWLYYCGPCRVGAHVNCLSSKHEDKGGAKTKGGSSSSSSSSGGKVEAPTRMTEEAERAAVEAQRRMLEKRLAEQLILDALDAAADYVGPSYTRRYYY